MREKMKDRKGQTKTKEKKEYKMMTNDALNTKEISNIRKTK